MRVSNVKETLRMMGSSTDPRMAKIIITMAEELAEHRQKIDALIDTVLQQMALMTAMHKVYTELAKSRGEERRAQHAGEILTIGRANLERARNSKNADMVSSESVSQEAHDGSVDTD